MELFLFSTCTRKRESLADGKKLKWDMKSVREHGKEEKLYKINKKERIPQKT